MQNGIENNQISNDEIDLKELFLVLKARKYMIYTIVTIGTLAAIVLSLFVMKPVYSVKSIIEIGTIAGSKKSSSVDSHTQDIMQKISYTYKIGVKEIKRELPFIQKISLSKNSNILSLEVYSRTNEEGVQYLQTVCNEIIMDTNKKIYKYIEDTKKQIKLFENDLKSSEGNYRNIKDSIEDMEKRVTSLAKVDPALAAIYAMQVSQKDLTLSEIKNTMVDIKNNIRELQEFISVNNIELTRMIDKIQVLENPIKPKKALLVTIGFITSLIFSIFLVFFLNFIEGIKKEDA